METRQRHELEAIPHICDLLLESSDGFGVKFGAPVERRRAIVGEQPARMGALHLVREFTRLAQIRGRGFPPHEVRIGRIGEAARNRMLDRMRIALLEAVEPLRGAAGAINEGMIVIIDV